MGVELRRLFATGLWAVTTVAATGLVWTATSVVASDVTDRPAPVVAHRDVVIALANGSAPAESVPAPTSTTPTTARTGPAKVATTLTTTPHAPPTTRPALVLPLVVTTTTSPGTRHDDTTVPRQVTPPPTQAPAPTATKSTKGGEVTVACTGPSTIRMISATPSDGYQVDRNVTAGPYFVQVSFIGEENVTVKAACAFGQPFFDNSGHQPGS